MDPALPSPSHAQLKDSKTTATDLSRPPVPVNYKRYNKKDVWHFKTHKGRFFFPQSYPCCTSQQFFVVWFQRTVTHSHARCRCCSCISAHIDVIFLAAFCKHTIKLCCTPQDLASLLSLLIMFITLPENRKPPENVRGGFMLADKQMLSDHGENIISSFSC